MSGRIDRHYGHALADEAYPLADADKLDTETLTTLRRLMTLGPVSCALGERGGGLPFAHATRLMEQGLIWMAPRFVPPVPGELAGASWREFEITPHGRDVLAALA